MIAALFTLTPSWVKAFYVKKLPSYNADVRKFLLVKIHEQLASAI
jgi:hypothetical protein